MPHFELWNDAADIPVFAWQLRPGAAAHWNLYHLSDRLRARGWQVPAYPMPADMEELTVQRIVVRNGFSHDLAVQFMADFRAEVAYLDSLDAPMTNPRSTGGFTH